MAAAPKTPRSFRRRPIGCLPSWTISSRFVNSTDADAVTQAAVSHAQFETIHPYGDGNGRIGRLLVLWTLARRLDVPVPPPTSVLIARDPGGYLSGLYWFRSGELARWVGWFADIVSVVVDRGARVVERSRDPHERMARSHRRSARRRGRALDSRDPAGASGDYRGHRRASSWKPPTRRHAPRSSSSTSGASSRPSKSPALAADARGIGGSRSSSPSSFAPRTRPGPRSVLMSHPLRMFDAWPKHSSKASHSS